MKEIRINGKGSFSDFGLEIKGRNISIPEKRSIRKTIPFRNGSLDYSNINGEIYWEDRTLQYVFDIAEWTTEEMEQIKDKVLDWLLNVHETKIEDDYTQGYFYVGSYDSNSWKEDFGQGELSITFVVYPYKFDNTRTELNIVATLEQQEITIINESSHRVIPIIVTDKEITIEINNNSYDLEVGENETSIYVLEKGINNWTITAKTEEANVNISYRKEVF